MVNEHLLKKGLTKAEVTEIRNEGSRKLVKKLPAYTFACCPYCQKENIEYIDTYSLDSWTYGGTDLYPKNGPVSYLDSEVFHCEHFFMTQPFIFVTKSKYPEDRRIKGDNFLKPKNTSDWQWVLFSLVFNVLYTIARIMFGLLNLLHKLFYRDENYFLKSKPYVIGMILEKQMAKAVLHVLPICEDIENDYVPSHLLFIITYFSEVPDQAWKIVLKEKVDRVFIDGDNFYTPTELIPERSEQYWYDLTYWIERNILYFFLLKNLSLFY